MTIEIEGLHDPILRDLIGTKVMAALEVLRPKAIDVRVGFADENGPKGGIDIRCGLTVELPRRSRLHGGATAASHRLAFEAALEILERQLARERERFRDVRRRPKKYYAAKRLFSRGARPDAAGGPRSAPPRSA